MNFGTTVWVVWDKREDCIAEDRDSRPVILEHEDYALVWQKYNPERYVVYEAVIKKRLRVEMV